MHYILLIIFALISRVRSKIPYLLECVVVPKPLGLTSVPHHIEV